MLAFREAVLPDRFIERQSCFAVRLQVAVVANRIKSHACKLGQGTTSNLGCSLLLFSTFPDVKCTTSMCGGRHSSGSQVEPVARKLLSGDIDRQLQGHQRLTLGLDQSSRSPRSKSPYPETCPISPASDLWSTIPGD